MIYYPTDIFVADILILAATSTIAFIAFGIDKALTSSGKKGLSETLMLMLTVIGGFGSLCAMILLKHKVNVNSFRLCAPLFACVTVIGDALLRMFAF